MSCEITKFRWDFVLWLDGKIWFQSDLVPFITAGKWRWQSQPPYMNWLSLTRVSFFRPPVFLSFKLVDRLVLLFKVVLLSLFLSFRLSFFISSPRYNRNGWLGVKHRVTYFFISCAWHDVAAWCLWSYNVWEQTQRLVRLLQPRHLFSGVYGLLAFLWLSRSTQSGDVLLGLVWIQHKITLLFTINSWINWKFVIWVTQIPHYKRDK